MEIADTGTDILAEDLPYIWERFYKVDKSHCRGDSGTGLRIKLIRNKM